MSTNRLPPDALSGILERLNGTVAKVTTLRQLLGDLESELNEIYEECENEIHARTAGTEKGQIIVDQERKRDVMKETSHMAGLEGPLFLQGRERDRELILTGREQRRNAREQEGDRRIERPKSEPNPDFKSKPIRSEPKGRSPSSIPGNSSGSAVSRGSKLSVGRNWLDFMSILRPWSRTAAVPRHVEIPSVPQPPHPFPFPEDIDPSCYPPELKREAYGWFSLFNPSPKTKRVLDINLAHTVEYYTYRVNCVRFSRDGEWLAIGSGTTAEVYNVKTGVRTCILDHGRKGIVGSVRFSPDGKYLATSSHDKQVRVWNITNKRCDHILEGHQASVYSVDFSPNGRFIVAGSYDGIVRIWDAHDWTSRVLTLDDHYLPVTDSHGFFSVVISPDGRYVAAGSSDSSVRIWEMETGVLLQRLRGHQDRVLSVVFTPDGKGLISGSRDKTLKYWDVSMLGTNTALTNALKTSTISSSPCLMNFTGHTYNILSTAVSHDGAWIVSGSADARVLFWDIRTGVLQFMLSGHRDNGVYGVELSPTGNLLATTGWDRKVRIWSYEVLV